MTIAAISCLSQQGGVIDFHIPTKCPKKMSCSSVPNSSPGIDDKEKTPMMDSQDMVTPPRKGQAKRTCPVVDTELRRSSRLKQESGGFRKNVCSDRRCLHCTPNPPTLLTQNIRKLGSDFCKLDAEELEDEVLLARKEQKKIGPSPKKRNGGGSTKNSKNKDDDASRNSKNKDADVN